MNIRHHPADAEALQNRLGGALAAALSVQAAGIPRDVAERLRASREQALARARFKPVAAGAAAPVLAGRTSSGAAVLGASPSWRLKLASALPLLVLLAGLVLIDSWNRRQLVLAAAEIDSLLLADNLPPAAYTDPGFGEFLRSPQPPQQRTD